MQKSSINNGIFLGIAMVISTYVLYLANPSLFLSARTIILFMIFIMILIKAGLDARKAQNGFITFGQAFINMFATGAIGVAFCTTFEYILTNFIDPSLIDMQIELTIEAGEAARELLGDYFGSQMDENFDKQLEILENSNPFSLDTIIKNYLYRLIAPVALMSSFVALIIKKRPNGNGTSSNDDNNEPRYIVNK